ncbi:MAG TPA: hypothetical protein VIH40_13815 [Xanthobacteraceae bacterium]
MATREDYDIVLRATDRTQGAFASARGGAKGLDSAVGMLRATLGSFGMALSGAALVSFSKDAVTALADIGSTAKRVGATTDAVQALRFQVKQGGGDFRDADTFLQRFAESASKAGTGGGYLAKVFHANGVALKDQNGNLKSSTELLTAYARLVANTTSHEDKLRLAREAGGKGSGAQMLETLEKIARYGLPSVIAEAKRLGVIVDKNLIDKADEVDRKWKLSTDQMSAYFKSVAVSAIGALQEFNDKASIAVALDNGTANLRQLQYAIALARKAGSPIDPSWIAQMERLLEMQRELNKGNLPAFRGDAKQTVLPLENDALEKQIASIRKHVAATEADAFAVDATAGAQAELRTRAQLTEAVLSSGVAVAGNYAAEIDKIAKRAGAAADMLAVMNLKSDILFERSQFGRSDTEQAIAARLRAAKLPMDETTQFWQTQMRINATLKTSEDLSISFADNFGQAMLQGKTRTEALNNAVRSLASSLMSMGSRQFVQGIFGLVTSSFGGAGDPGGADGTGFDLGGYTGAVGRNKIAGVVHGDEFVVNADATARYRGLLEAINASPIRGYEAGGFVGSSSIAAWSGGPVAVNVQPVVSVHIENNSGQQVAVSRQKAPTGFDVGLLIEAIDGAMAQRQADGTGSHSKVLRDQYGVSRKFA